MRTGSVAPSASLHVRGEVSVRLLALELGADGGETYRVSFSPARDAPFRAGRMTHAGGPSWDLVDDDATTRSSAPLGSPEEVFGLALGEGQLAAQAVSTAVPTAAPHWPASFPARLAARRLTGQGTVAFDAGWFLSELATSAIDRPLLFPNAASKLGLAGLERASAIMRDIAATSADTSLPVMLLQALRSERGANGWDGEGRLIAEFASGELAQLGADVTDGCRAAIGAGPLRVVFAPGVPLGLGLGPLIPGDARDDASVGAGAEVGEVDAGGAAEQAGVQVGMVLARLSEPELVLASGGHSSLPFEEVLDAIDQRRATGAALTITFDTAAPVANLYAVEMPAAAAITALAEGAGLLPEGERIDVDAGAALRALCGPALLWREDEPRLFLGEAGSLTCAHTDICPQLEVAHGLLGLKLLGVASHDATPRLCAEHVDDDAADADDEDATRVPTDRPLTLRQERLLGDDDVTVVLLQRGDLAVFDSGALHFASNGADGLNCALYHGMVTPAAVPRLRRAAATPIRSAGAYRDHLFAADLLREVEPLLAKLAAAEPEPPSSPDET